MSGADLFVGPAALATTEPIMPPEPERFSLISFRVMVHGQRMDYAAVRASDGLWYTTGQSVGVQWATLVREIRWRLCSPVKVHDLNGVSCLAAVLQLDEQQGTEMTADVIQREELRTRPDSAAACVAALIESGVVTDEDVQAAQELASGTHPDESTS